MAWNLITNTVYTEEMKYRFEFEVCEKREMGARERETERKGERESVWKIEVKPEDKRQNSETIRAYSEKWITFDTE